MSSTETLIDRLGKTAMDCRGLVREMHEAEQSLKAATRDARTVIEELQEAVDRAVSTNIDALVHKYIDELGEHTKTAMAKTSQKIMAEFERLAAPLMAALDEIKVVVDAKQRRFLR